MKRNLQVILAVLLIGFGFGGISLAGNCIQEDLWDITTATICINKRTDGNDVNRRIKVTCENAGCKATQCFTHGNLGCGGTYSDKPTTEDISINISLYDMPDQRYTFRGKFDFQNGTRLENDLESNNYNSAKNSTTYVDISAPKTTLYIGESTDLIIKTNKDYTGDILIEKDRESGRHTIGEPDGWEYTMKSSDNGIKILSNFIKFNSAGTYNVYITNSENKQDSLTFTVNKKKNYVVIDDEDTVDEEIVVENAEEKDPLLEGLKEIISSDNKEMGINDENKTSQLGLSSEDEQKVPTNSLTQTTDKSRYEEGNQEIILSNGYSRELNNAYKFAYVNGITTKQDIKLADMDGNLNRISMAKMLSQYAMNVLKKTPDTSKRCSFSDVTMQIDSDYNNGVTLACQLGIMGVGIDKFRPYDEVARAEFGTALSRMLFGLSDGAPYYSTHLAKLKEEKIIDNDNPNLKELRGYVMLMLMRSAM